MMDDIRDELIQLFDLPDGSGIILVPSVESAQYVP